MNKDVIITLGFLAIVAGFGFYLYRCDKRDQGVFKEQQDYFEWAKGVQSEKFGIKPENKKADLKIIKNEMPELEPS